MNDLISIIMPVKNGEKYIQEALDGIKKQDMNIEIIVVDDASSDKTAEIAKHSGCKVISLTNSKGPVVAKNIGLKEANGNYIMFHDHDDVMNDGAMKALYEHMVSDSDIKVVMAKVKDFCTDSDNKDKVKPDAYYGLFTGAVLIKKEVFDIIGLFDENLTAGEIISFQSKLQSSGIEIKKIDFISTNRRIHDSNFGRVNQKQEYKDYANILRNRMLKRSNNPEKQQNNTNSLGGGDR